MIKAMKAYGCNTETVIVLAIVALLFLSLVGFPPNASVAMSIVVLAAVTFGRECAPIFSYRGRARKLLVLDRLPYLLALAHVILYYSVIVMFGTVPEEWSTIIVTHVLVTWLMKTFYGK